MSSDPRSEQDKQREQGLRLLEDHIGRHLADSARSGELARAPSYGRPLDFGDGYDETPPELRMAMKVLKDAGVVPPEVETMREIAALQGELDALAPGDATAVPLRQRIADKRAALALRLERLRRTGEL